MKKRKKKGSSRKKVLDTVIRVLLIAVAAAGALICCRSLVNGIFLDDYRSERYSEYPERLMLPLKFGENYVVPYNLGNAAYQQGNYAGAVQYYLEALENHPPEEEKECSVRINLALAILHLFPFDTMDAQDTDQVDEAVKVLLSARSVLTENGCACEETDRWDGHSEEAEKLKRDIDDMLRKLMPPSGSDGGDEQPEDGGGKSESDGNGGGEDNADSSQDQQDGSEPADASGEAGEQMRKQEQLRTQLDEQKEALESGAYQGAEYNEFTYIDISETIGYGEGTPW